MHRALIRTHRAVIFQAPSVLDAAVPHDRARTVPLAVGTSIPTLSRIVAWPSPGADGG